MNSFLSVKVKKVITLGVSEGMKEVRAWGYARYRNKERKVESNGITS